MNDTLFDITQCHVSLFGAGIGKACNQKPYKNGTLADVYDWMNNDRIMMLTQQLRAIQDENEQKRFKAERLPFVTFSGTFRYRKAEGLIQHSGLQCFDFDHLGGEHEVYEVRNRLLHDPYFTTELMFTSPRGNGVKWVTHIDIDRNTHEEWYDAIMRYLKQTYGMEADSAPSSVVSACFLCYDPVICINTKCRV